MKEIIMNFFEELTWRGMVADSTPGTEKILATESLTGYVGFDPTATSLHIGNLVAIMLLVHFQRCGHKPIALVGGATGMIGDPSGKSIERNLLTIDEIRFNQECIRKQLARFLDFDCGANSAEIVNNYDWFKEFRFLDFLRDVGKHLSISYMLAKDSVQSRLAGGISFTEFSYQLLQGYDFFHLNQTKQCRIQMGGTDQWGNITAGTELIRKKSGNEVFALTTPLLTRSDGTKFGKSEGGQNVWLDASRTSPYRFYQFWLNLADADVPRLLKVFSLKSKDELDELIALHNQAPHERALQKALAQELTTRVHSAEAVTSAIEASDILFGKGTTEALKKISTEELLDIMSGVPMSEISRKTIEPGVGIVDVLSDQCGIFPSKGEARRMVAAGGISLNKQKVDSTDARITAEDLLQNQYLLIQKGKKNYHLIKVIG